MAQTFQEPDWSERICTISIHPDSATVREIAELAAELMECRRDRNEARYHARNLAHAWKSDNRPPSASVIAGLSYAVDQR